VVLEHLMPSILTQQVFYTPAANTTLSYGAHSFNFHSVVNAGTYLVRIQWKVFGGTEYVGARTLIVIALPEDNK